MAQTSKEDALKSDIKDDLQKMRESSESLKNDLGELARDMGMVARRFLDSTNEATKERAAYAREVTEKQVHDHPIQSLAVALGVGVALGFLFRR